MAYAPKTRSSRPHFAQVWEEIERLYLDSCRTLVAHNAAFDRSCIQKAALAHRLHLPELQWHCTMQTARKLYRLPSYKLTDLCAALDIHTGQHHRAGDDAQMCALIYLRELQDMSSLPQILRA